MKPFRPTIGEAAYKALKAQAAQRQPPPAPLAPLAPRSSTTGTTLTNPINFDGVNENLTDGWFPPDTEGAVGPKHFVEITNSHLDIYQKAAPNTRVKSVPLSSFFNYTAEGLFDVRVIYDSAYGRWIVSADSFAESNKVEPFFFAVSQTADPTGAYYIYNVNVNDPNYPISEGNNGWDFPQVGLDQNAVIFTADYYDDTGNYVDSRLFTVAKSLLYNGPSQTLTPHLFTGLNGTLTPPIVRDANPSTYLVAPDYSGTSSTTVWIYTLTNSAANPPTLNSPDPITVDPYSLPANAPQPGYPTTYLIDTSDARFVNASTQIGNSLFQVHSIARDPNAGTGAICRFYEFNTLNKDVIQSGTFSRSNTSFDFNASITANRRRDVFITWSATDPTNNAYAEVRFAGRLHADPAGVIGPGSLLYSSTVALTGNKSGDTDTTQRWGDYSAVFLDSADPTGVTAWIVNETIVDLDTWGSRIGEIKLPPWFNPAAMNLLLLLD